MSAQFELFELPKSRKRPVPILPRDSGKRLNARLARKILKRAREAHAWDSTFELQQAVVYFPSFLSRSYLIELDLESATTGACSALLFVSGAGIFPLSGSSNELQAIQSAPDFCVDRFDQALDYLKLYCRAIGTDSGTFQIISAASDIPWATRAQLDPDKTRFVPIFAPSAIGSHEPELNQTPRRIETSTLYLGNLFRSTFLIEPDGHIVMENDHSICSNLPVYNEVYFNGVRCCTEFDPGDDG